MGAAAAGLQLGCWQLSSALAAPRQQQRSLLPGRCRLRWRWLCLPAPSHRRKSAPSRTWPDGFEAGGGAGPAGLKTRHFGVLVVASLVSFGVRFRWQNEVLFFSFFSLLFVTHTAEVVRSVCAQLNSAGPGRGEGEKDATGQ